MILVAALNIVLSAVVLIAIVGSHAWTIATERRVETGRRA
jgi:hypothetical protein